MVYIDRFIQASATYQTGQDIVVRQQFVSNGKLANTKDTNFRAVQNDWPVFAFAHDLGTVSGSSAPVVFAVGHVRDPAIEYIVAGGKTQNRSLFFWSKFSTVSAAVRSISPPAGQILTHTTIACFSDRFFPGRL